MQANETLEILLEISNVMPKIFIVEEFLKRIPATMNYYLMHIVGEKSLEYKVKDPNDINYEPIKTLKTLIEFYVNLSAFEEFLEEVP